MKMKFVAETKDIVMFLIFAVFLLYIVALGVLNFPQLAGTGTFYGLNPIKAFTPEYIGYTLFFYVFSLAALFMSVSSYFFEFDSGFGFSTSKKEKGYSRWLKEKEMKKALKCVHPKDEKSDYAGIPLISKNGELWVDDGEFHNLVIGATGSGKTQSTILPSVKILAKKGESMICTDPKGEIYEKTGAMLKEKGYDIILLNFRNPQRGNAWNPLSLPYRLYKSGNKDKAIELLDDLALNILYEENNGNADPFWEKTSADYFSGLALAMFEDTTEDKININSINLTTTVGEEKFQGSTYVKEYFNMKDPSSAAYTNASGTIMAPSETKGSILSVFKQKVKLFASRENLSEMLSYSDFDMRTIGQKPTAVFIIIQDEKKTYHSLATIFVKQCYETLIDVAQENGGKLPCRTNFLLDEFANMPPLKDVTTMITAARSRQIRFTLIIQNFAQLKQVYGEQNAETIKGNCGNLIYLISTELAALEEISKLAGEEKSKKDDKTASKPLVTVSDLQRMKQFDQIVLRMRMNPFKTSFTPDFKIDWGKTYGEVTYPERQKHEIKVFDVREFVKEKKRQEAEERSKQFGSNPFADPVGGNPFAAMLDNMTRRDNYPNAQPSNLPRQNPMMGGMGNNSFNGFNFDELTRKIDQRIAELEREEMEKSKKANTVESKPVSVLPPKKETKSNIEHLDDSLEEEKDVDTHLDTKEKKKNSPVDFSEQLLKGLSNKEKTTSNPTKDTTIKNKKEFNLSLDSLEEKINKKLDEQVFDQEFNPYEALDLSGLDSDLDIDEDTTDKQTDDVVDAEIIENNQLPEEQQEVIEPEKIEKIDDKIEEKEDFKEKESIDDSDEVVTSPKTPTIKLSDVSEDDKFFDDFFDD